ncbi:MAG: histone deacetylase family protein, partial [Gammaproteobacteria bacterium]
MTTLYYSHQDFYKHDPGFGHPECAERLESIDRALKSPGFEKLVELKPPLAGDVLEKIALIHTQEYIDFILKAVPDRGYRYLDGDTVLSPG